MNYWSNYLYMSSVDSEVIPTASACCFPSAITATTWPFSTGDIRAPGEVRPGHMILAPLSTKRMAPLSTCCIGRKKGSENIMEKFGKAKKLASMKSVYILLLLLSYDYTRTLLQKFQRFSLRFNQSFFI